MYINACKRPVIRTSKRLQQLIRTHRAAGCTLKSAPTHVTALLAWQCGRAPAAAPISCCKYHIFAHITYTKIFLNLTVVSWCGLHANFALRCSFTAAQILPRRTCAAVKPYFQNWSPMCELGAHAPPNAVLHASPPFNELPLIQTTFNSNRF